MENISGKIKVVAFDADDTLWDCQSQFVKVEEEYARLLSEYASEKEISDSLFSVETANMPLLGYGCKAFMISLVENAIQISHGKVSAATIETIINLGRTLLELPSTPLPEVVEVLSYLKEKGYRLVVFTKGELLDQENKLRRSGLLPFFCHVEIVSDKTPQRVAEMCRDLQISPDELLMVGNSFKSDIIPAIESGAYAAHIPYKVMWAHELTREFAHDRIFSLKRLGELKQFV